MNRTVKGDRRPPIKPVERINLTERHLGRRLVAFLVCLAVAIISISYGVHSLLTVEPGWFTVDVGRSVKTNCAGEFTFRYYLGLNGSATRSEQNAVVARYTQAAVDGYQIFNSWEEIEDVHNLWYLNRHPNEVVEISEALYTAFSRLEEAGSRLLYLGPVYEVYQSLFFCQDDAQIYDFDPFQNPEIAEFCRRAAEFSRDSGAVNLELLGENKVCLTVSEQYAAFAKENEIETYLDFFWLKNAFLADYLADTMVEGGFTNGFLSSYDGFSRSLTAESEYSLPLYDRADGRLVEAGRAELVNVSAVVSLHSFPLEDREEALFYELRGGGLRLPFVDSADGLSRTSVDSLTAYSEAGGCAELLLGMIPFYIREPLAVSDLEALKAAVPSAVALIEGEFFYADSSLTVSQLYQNEGTVYQASLIP